MSAVESGILAGTFVICVIATLALAAVLMGMFPALACPSCKKKRDVLGDEDLSSDDNWLCCLATQACCWRFCGFCRPERLKKYLLEDIEERRRQQQKEDEEAAERAEEKRLEDEEKAKEEAERKAEEKKKRQLEKEEAKKKQKKREEEEKGKEEKGE